MIKNRIDSEQSKSLVRYCPECGHIGEVGAGHRDCCPDGSHAVMVPKAVANQARDGFMASIEAEVRTEAQEPMAMIYGDRAYRSVFKAGWNACANGDESLLAAIGDRVVLAHEYTSKHPPAPCPKCAEFALFPNVDALRQCMIDTADENDALKARVAEQSAEIERLKGEAA